MMILTVEGQTYEVEADRDGTVWYRARNFYYPGSRWRGEWYEYELWRLF